MSEQPEFPTPIKTGAKNFYFRCSIPDCPYQCRSYHLYNLHVEDIHECEDCALYVENKAVHNCKTPGLQGGHVDSKKRLELGVFKEYSRAHKGTLITYLHVVDPPTRFINEVFERVTPSMESIYRQLFDIYTSIYSYVAAKVVMEREHDGVITETTTYFRCDDQKIFNIGDANIPAMMSEIDKKIDEFVSNGSGWRVQTVENLEFKVADLRFFTEAKGKRYLKMPLQKQGYLNIENKDPNCFVYCICAALHMKEVPKGSMLKSPHLWKKFIPLHDFSDVMNKDIDIQRDIDAFELKNSVNINVFSHKEKHVLPIRRSKQKFETVINLFLIEEVRDGEKLYHYVLITDLDKFLSNCNMEKKFLCQYCFRKFPNERAEALHSIKCRDGDATAVTEEIWPEDWQKLQFHRYEMTLPYPFILLYDFETYNSPINKQKGKSTTVNSEFLPASYSIVIVQQGNEHSTLVGVEYYDGPNVMEHFFKRLFKWGQRLINRIRRTNNAVNPSEEVLERHRAAESCFLCRKEFTKPEKKGRKRPLDEPDWEDAFEKKKVIKTFHHNHHTGEYVGALCQGCNLKVKYKSELVCIAHNSTGFDMHLIVQALDCKLFDAKDVNVIAKNSERFIQMTLTANSTYIDKIHNPKFDEESSWTCPKVRLRFIDSFQFRNSSLRTLTENLRKDNSPFFSLVREAFSVMLDQPGRRATDEDLQYLLRKLEYPYSYLTSPEVLEPGHPIPPRKYFDNDLTDEPITDKDYNSILEICERFNIKDFKGLTRLYTILDTVLLSVVWESFRKGCFSIYGLDPTYVATISSFSWNAFLYKTGASVDYIRDKQMLEMITDGIRGGPCFATQKIVTANNERTPAGYDPLKPRTHLVYFDVVSLYAHALCGKYPMTGYEWVDVKDLEKIDWTDENLGDDDVGYILKVDLEYCHSIHDRTSSLPLAPSKKTIEIHQLSDKQQRQVSDLGPMGKSFISQSKLISDCSDKIEYVIHYNTLRFYLQQGLKLKKIHCGFKFVEKPYFRKYIMDNIERRKLATTTTDRDLIKLCNNSIYGRTLMSNKNLLEVKFCRTRVEALEHIASPFLTDFKILNPNLSIFMFQPEKIKHDKIVQAGFTVLEIAKKIYYEGFHVKLRSVFGDRITNVYNDTDSSICLIEDEQNTFYQDLVDHKHLFDWSKIPDNAEILKLYPECKGLNAGESGTWKIESYNISEGAFLKSKQYGLSYFEENDDDDVEMKEFEELKCKGIQASSLKNTTVEDYKNVIKNEQVIQLLVKCIRSNDHRLYKFTMRKVALHCLDANRVYPDPLNINYSLPFGHKDLIG